jgi:aspartyl-tRNA(Asn)/glutamyl-tRNA(Gln) amidotransferase subunit B
VYKVPYTISSVLVWDRALSDFFEETARLSGKPQASGNWIVNDLLRELGNARIPVAGARVRPGHIAELIRLIDSGELLVNAAKEVFVEMFATGVMPGSIAETKGLKAVAGDIDELEKWCRDAIAANPRSLADFKAGKDSAINGFKGAVMKAAKGKASPKLVDETLRRVLANL